MAESNIQKPSIAYPLAVLPCVHQCPVLKTRTSALFNSRLVDAVDLQDRVGVALPVEAHPFADQKMRPRELHGAVVVLRLICLTDTHQG
jgi:hypothetical protein